MIKYILAVLLFAVSLSSYAGVTRPDPSYVKLDGEITPAVAKEILLQYKKKPFKAIVATSPGGDYQSGVILAKFVSKYDIGVYVPEYCHSACSMIFFATSERLMDKNAIIGIHNISFELGEGQKSTDMVTIAEASKFAQQASMFAGQMIALYAAAGVPGDVLVKVSQISGSEMIRLNYVTLRRWGVVE